MGLKQKTRSNTKLTGAKLHSLGMENAPGRNFRRIFLRRKFSPAIKGRCSEEAELKIGGKNHGKGN